MLIIRRSDCTITESGIVTLKTSEWSKIPKKKKKNKIKLSYTKMHVQQSIKILNISCHTLLVSRSPIRLVLRAAVSVFTEGSHFRIVSEGLIAD